jgi:hypothetical protein
MKILKDPSKKAKITVPPNSRIPIDTSDLMFSHHCIQLVLGKRMSGKSVFITNYLRMLKEENKADRILVVSPTILSNKALLDSLDIESSDCFDPDDSNVVPNLINIIDEERDEWEKYLEMSEKWDRLQKLINNESTPVEMIDPYLLLSFSDEYGRLQKPVSKYGHFPVLHIFVDDSQSSAIFRDKKFLNLAIRHRHLGGLKKGGALGTSLYIAIQNLKAQGGSCPKAIRNNATQLVIVGKVKDEKELEDIYSSVAGEVSKDDFMKGYEYSTKEPHNSFVIDLHPKKNHASRFRKNLNEFIIMDK